ILYAELRKPQARERVTVRGKRPANDADLAAEGDDRGEDVVAGAAVERPLVEIIDLALDTFDEEEVPDEDLINERGDEVASRQIAKTGFPVDLGAEPVERLDRAFMDGQDDVATREEVDLAADQARRLRVV